MSKVAGGAHRRARERESRFTTMTAEEKVAALDAMGFTPLGSDHQPDCPYALDPGLRCNCVPPATVWAQPHDVDVLRGETWEQRKAAPRRRIPDVER